MNALVNYARYEFPRLVSVSEPEQSSIRYLDVEPYYLLNLPGTTDYPGFSDNLISVIQNHVPLYSSLVSAMSDIGFALLKEKKSPDGFTAL